MATDDRPIISCAGNQSLFASVHPYIVDALSMQKIDWQRSYGRPIKKVRLCGHFVPFDVHQLPRKFNEYRLLKDPVLHIYWVDCDIDTYKKKVRDDLFMWQSALKALSILDWLIIVVVRDENKVKSKILRTSVYDKVKSEYGSRGSGRCILFPEPFRNDTKSETWITVISRIQELMLASFSRVISKFEDAMRLERERRNEESWTFAKYFMLQESLAKFYSVVELYEDALVQYDELDALFAQFIVNHSVGAKTAWLIPYTQLASGWEGVSMSTDINLYRRMLISEDKPSLLDLRNYMFSRQCELLIRLERPSELTSRSIKFVHNTIHELGLLEVSMPSGAISTWVFLTCKELLSVCEPFKDTLGMEVYSTYTSPLWTCLQAVTHKLGSLCGLFPGTVPTSQELHSVVELVSGISGSSTASKGVSREESTQADLRPREMLRKVLSSPADFRDYYVQLTELTMGTLKYIGHTRMAKILGQQLAKFYMASGEAQQAEAFLLDSLQLFSNDKWTSLELDTWVQLALCEQMLGSNAAYLRACLKVASHSKAPLDMRLEFADRILQFTHKEPIVVIEDCAMLATLDKVTYKTTSRTADILFTLHSELPAAFTYDTLSLLIQPSDGKEETRKPAANGRKRCCQSMPLTMYKNVNDQGETSFGLTCVSTHSLLSHKDSASTGHMIRNLSKNNTAELEGQDQELAASLTGGHLTHGVNRLLFALEEPGPGRYRVHQVRLRRPGLELFVRVQDCGFTIAGYSPPSITVSSEANAIYMGIDNILDVSFAGNHCPVLPKVSSPFADTFTLQASNISLPLERCQISFYPSSCTVTPGTQSMQLDFTLQAQQGCEDLVISEEIECSCPIEITSKTFTARDQKYIQITVFSLVHGRSLQVLYPTLTCKSSPEEGSFVFEMLHGVDEDAWRLTRKSELSFLWRLQSAEVCGSDTIKCAFSIDFFCCGEERDRESKYHTFSTDISVDIVKTQYIMTRYIKSGIPMSPLSLSRQSSQDKLSSSPESLFPQPPPNTWQALCECEMSVELESCGALDFTEDDSEVHCISYEIISDPNWAISGNKHGQLELTSECLLSSIGVKLMPLTSGHLRLPEVRLRNSNDEEFLPGQVYDNSKLSQVFISSPEE